MGYFIGVLLVKEAGGRISKMDGEEWTINSRDILASNTKIHNDLTKNSLYFKAYLNI